MEDWTRNVFHWDLKREDPNKVFADICMRIAKADFDEQCVMLFVGSQNVVSCLNARTKTFNEIKNNIVYDCNEVYLILVKFESNIDNTR